MNAKHVVPGDGNIFADLGLEDAEVLKIRAQLMAELKRYIEASDMNQTELALALNVRRPAISAAVNGNVDECSIERLIKMIIAAGGTVNVSVKIPKQSRK